MSKLSNKKEIPQKYYTTKKIKIKIALQKFR